MTACLGLHDALRGLILTGAVCLMAQCVSLERHRREERDRRERAQVCTEARRYM